jgi:hypothetical protein
VSGVMDDLEELERWKTWRNLSEVDLEELE